MRYLQKGCYGFLAYMVGTRVEDTSTLSELPFVRDLTNVFPKEFSELPPERQVQFRD